MLTQLELLGGSGGLGVDEDSGMSASPLDGLADYPMEQAEFEYFESSLPTDVYYDMPQGPELHHSPSLSLAPISTTTLLPLSTSLYDATGPTSAPAPPSLYEPATFGDNLGSPPGLKTYEDLKSADDELKFDEDMPSYEELTGGLYDGGLRSSDTQTEEFDFGSLYDSLHPSHDSSQGSPETELEPSEIASLSPSGKGKIGPLQRSALDSIFSVTEKPSRGLVLHIAAELGLHHLTVKNFFSNGRRRLRRAAARLNDPERTKRENERRKEKRRLAALASAAFSGDGVGKNIGSGAGGGKTMAPLSPPSTQPPCTPTKEPPVVSPERKALMEKLADKVQRSVAQRSLAGDLDLSPHPSTNSLTPTTASVAPTLNPQPPHDILVSSTHDILPPECLLVGSGERDLLGEAAGACHSEWAHNPHSDLSASPSALLHPHDDPWSLF